MFYESEMRRTVAAILVIKYSLNRDHLEIFTPS